MTVRLLSSCDRYNYGDLLFPIITKLALDACAPGEFQIHNYGLRNSDLSATGALPCRGIRELFQDTRPGDCVLLAGGENLAQTWLVMHETLLGAAGGKRLRWLERRAPRLAETVSRRMIGGKQPFPYILDPGHFPPGVRVFYNSMGGWPLAHYAAAAQQEIVRSLKRASFLSVREDQTASILRSLSPEIPLHVAPDVVFLLLDYILPDRLRRMASAEVRTLVDNAGDFIAFQCHPRFGRPNRAVLLAQLQRLSASTGMRLFLTPIGRMPSFEDDLFLNEIAGELRGSVILPRNATIFDVAHVLAACQLFCGTSLHGLITAFTYGNPFLALANEDPKTKNNLRSWRVTDNFPPAPCGELKVRAEHSLSVKLSWLAEAVVALRRRSRKNFLQLAHAMASSKVEPGNIEPITP